MRGQKLSSCSRPSLHTILLRCAPDAAMAMAMTTLPLQAHEMCPCSCSYSSQISTSVASSSSVRTAGIFRLRTPKVWSVGVGRGARAMAPDEEKMTRRSPLDFPVVRPLSKSSPSFFLGSWYGVNRIIFCFVNWFRKPPRFWLLIWSTWCAVIFMWRHHLAMPTSCEFFLSEELLSHYLSRVGVSSGQLGMEPSILILEFPEDVNALALCDAWTRHVRATSRGEFKFFYTRLFLFQLITKA